MFQKLTTDMATNLFDLVGLCLFFLLLWRCRTWRSLIISGGITIGALECFLYPNSVLTSPADVVADFCAFMIDLCALRGLQKGWVAVLQKQALKTRAQRIAFLSLCAALLLLIGQLAVYSLFGHEIDNLFGANFINCITYGYPHYEGRNGSCYEDLMLWRPLVYFNIIWIIVSLICVSWWPHLRLINNWLETDTSRESQPNAIEIEQNHLAAMPVLTEKPEKRLNKHTSPWGKALPASDNEQNWHRPKAERRNGGKWFMLAFFVLSPFLKVANTYFATKEADRISAQAITFMSQTPAIEECERKWETGEFATHLLAYNNCQQPLIMAAYKRAGVMHQDSLQSLSDVWQEMIAKTDSGEVTSKEELAARIIDIISRDESEH